jgi:hypothetical protein
MHSDPLGLGSRLTEFSLKELDAHLVNLFLLVLRELPRVVYAYTQTHTM